MFVVIYYAKHTNLIQLQGNQLQRLEVQNKINASISKHHPQSPIFHFVLCSVSYHKFTANRVLLLLQLKVSLFASM